MGKNAIVSFSVYIHSLLNNPFGVLLCSSQQTRDQEDPCHFLLLRCLSVKFTPYPALDNFCPLQIRIKVQEPERLRIKLIFKNNKSFHIFSSHLYGAGNS